jgi:hypothetical protein
MVEQYILAIYTPSTHPQDLELTMTADEVRDRRREYFFSSSRYSQAYGGYHLLEIAQGNLRNFLH